MILGCNKYGFQTHIMYVVASFVVSVVYIGCGDTASVISPEQAAASGAQSGKADHYIYEQVPSDFPVAQDLAIVFPLWTDNRIVGSELTLTGEPLLSERWLEAVNEAFLDTVVEDAVARENVYDDWRIVSVRFAPCGALGSHFGQSPESLCWPQVRVVWQPVLEDLLVLWVRPFFGDDRAIHALYHVMPEPTESSLPLQRVREILASGEAVDTLSKVELDAFTDARNQALNRWVKLVYSLRTEGVAPEDTVGIRTELNTMDVAQVARFTDALRRVLAQTAIPEYLFDLTAFSLPEGRDAPQIDLWSFIAFDAEHGELEQRSLLVQSPFDGAIVGDAGLDETVTMNGADQELSSWRQESALAEELKSLVVFSDDDKPFLGEIINDPTQTLVTNTSCSSCHRFNEQKFDFHALSHLEDNEATIAPRVLNDVAHEIAWLRGVLGRL